MRKRLEAKEGLPEQQVPPVIELLRTGHLTAIGRDWRNNSRDVYVIAVHIVNENDSPIQEARALCFPMAEVQKAQQWEVEERAKIGKSTDISEALSRFERGLMLSSTAVSFVAPSGIGSFPHRT